MRKLTLLICLSCLMFTVAACSKQKVDSDDASIFGLERKTS